MIRIPAKILLPAAASLFTLLGVSASSAVVYCRPGVVVANCVARPAAPVARAAVATPGAPAARAAVRRPGPGVNVNGGVNRAGVR